MVGIRVSFNDLTGQTIGHLTVLAVSRTEPTKQRGFAYFWRCRCICGLEFEASHKALRRGHRTNCGCMDVPNRLTHGGTRTPEYRVWGAMRERCENPRSKNYKNYGAIGRTVCERWHSFANFIADMGRRPTPLHTLERIDNSLGYSPDNCKWATRKEQMRNVRYNRLLTHDGRTMCVTAWGEAIGVNPQRIWKRINRGWSAERALTTPWN